MDNLEQARSLLKKYLSNFEFDQNSISRIVEKDLDFLTTWELPPDPPEKISSAEALIAFSFGFGPSKVSGGSSPDQYDPLFHYPGKPNEALADTILNHWDENRPIFTQLEIAEVLKKRGKMVPPQQIAKPGKTYLGTSGVVNQFIDNGLGQFKSVLLIAHKHHTFRCRAIVRKVFEKRGIRLEVTVPILPGIYDPNSLQPWTRSLEAWVSYEVSNRFQARYKGLM